MEDFIISKMEESTFDNMECMLEYKEYDYKILGDKSAFIVYYKIGDLFWVHFLWADKKKQMYRVLKEFEKIAPPKSNIILFDCDYFSDMFGSHARKIYVWEKELK